MFLDIENRNHKIRIRLTESKKTGENHYKKVVLNQFGPFPEKLTLNDKEIQDFLKELVKDVQNKSEKPSLEDLEWSDREYCDFLCGLLESEPSQTYNLGVLLLDKMFDFFKLHPLFKKLQKQTRRKYNLADYFKFLVYFQILEPGSILSYYQNQERVTHFLKIEEIKLEDLYDFLSFYYSHRLEFQQILFETVLKLLGKHEVQIFYYDGTNFYFEISKADPDNLDELNAEVHKGLRKYGLSKENRQDPLVSLGIISCDFGIPLFFTVFPGNEQEITYLYDDLENLSRELARHDFTDRLLLCADAGNYSGDLIYRIAKENLQARSHLEPDNDAYIIGRGFRSTDEETQKWALSKKGYYPISVSKKGRKAKKRKKERATFVKSRLVEIPVKVKLKSGRTVTKHVWQKQLAIFSTKRKYREEILISNKIDKASQISKSKAKVKKVVKKVSSEYLKLHSEDAQTGETVEDFTAQLDLEKIQRDLEASGLFIITTSLYNWADGKILHAYRGKYIGEDVFKEAKSVVKIRPIYVRTPEHIVAHIELGVVSLIFLDTLRHLVELRTAHSLSAAKTQSLLHQFQASPLSHSCYRITGNDENLKLLLNTFELDMDAPVMLEKDIFNLFE